MRKFSSYGPVDKDLHYYVPRKELVASAWQQLRGEPPSKGGHYITVWAPRQRGKTWVMREVLWTLQKDPYLDVLKLNLEHLKMTDDVDVVINDIAKRIIESLALDIAPPEHLNQFYDVFKRGVLQRPLVLIMDEFDALTPDAINGIASVFRNIYIQRQDQADRPSEARDYLLHGVALIGVRSVLGIENQRGSPFNVQRSLHIPNLTADEVNQMYHWYIRESGQEVAQDVIDRVYYETQGQPGLVSWFGELLTETYNESPDRPITMPQFERVYSLALNVLPNNNILNVISKARQEPYRSLVLQFFQTGKKTNFRYDEPHLNHLYMNGVIDWELAENGEYYVKFPCPFVQKRLFNYFAFDLYSDVGRLYKPFEDLSDTITERTLNVKNLLRRYQAYLHQNRRWLWHDVPRRKTDLRPFEAVYHFNLYMYLYRFLERRKAQVVPEFPTGNGKIDLLIRYAGRLYGIEVKSFVDDYEYKLALQQAARYGRQLNLPEITLAVFVEDIDEANRARYEVPHHDPQTGVVVIPVFIAINENPVNEE